MTKLLSQKVMRNEMERADGPSRSLADSVLHEEAERYLSRQGTRESRGLALPIQADRYPDPSNDLATVLSRLGTSPSVRFSSGPEENESFERNWVW
jgi:hypothetical protein